MASGIEIENFFDDETNEDLKKIIESESKHFMGVYSQIQ